MLVVETGKNGSTLERMKGLGLQTEADEAEQIPSSSEVLEINIDELAQWIFGYKTLEETLGVMPPFWTEYVRTLQGVFWTRLCRRKRIWMKNGSS